jgi:MinD superfamily P-loop ATPase
MKQLVILSGKGGTGKTSVTAALAHLAHLDETIPGVVLADADVDAADLELLVGSHREEEGLFPGGAIAEIVPDLCTGCGICEAVCRFDAIREVAEEGVFEVLPIACEGCATCYYQCPEGAIQRIPQLAGHWFRSSSRYGHLFHARLRPAQENSGKLVTLVKEKARDAAVEQNIPLVIVDGPPGIGCPAIAAVTESDLALIVTEPTISGIHDLERAVEMTRHFRIPALVCVNKGDIYPKGREEIEALCREWGFRTLGWIPFDRAVTESMVAGKPVTECRPESGASLAIIRVWKELKEALRETPVHQETEQLYELVGPRGEHHQKRGESHE